MNKNKDVLKIDKTNYNMQKFMLKIGISGIKRWILIVILKQKMSKKTIYGALIVKFRF